MAVGQIWQEDLTNTLIRKKKHLVNATYRELPIDFQW